MQLCVLHLRHTFGLNKSFVIALGKPKKTWPVGGMIKDIAMGAGGRGIDSRADQIGSVSLTAAATFLWSCAVQALSRRDGPHHSLHA